MKKLLFILMVLFTSAVSAQKQYSIYATQSANWDGNTWTYNNIKPNEMTLTIQGKVVLISDNAHSSYYCHTQKNENAFYAYDEKSRRCLVYFNTLEGYNLVAVMYEDFLVRYYYQ